MRNSDFLHIFGILCNSVADDFLYDLFVKKIERSWLINNVNVSSPTNIRIVMRLITFFHLRGKICIRQYVESIEAVNKVYLGLE